MKKERIFSNSMIIGTFLVMYLVAMCSATFVVKENYVSEYQSYLYNLGFDLKERLTQESDYVREESEKKPGRELSYLNYMISIHNKGLNEFQQISMAIYDTEGNLYAKTDDMFGSSTGMYRYEDFFTEEEVEKLLDLYPESEDEENPVTCNGNFYVSLFYLDGYKEPMGMELRRFGDGELLWSWTNVLTGPEGYENYDEEQTGYLFFPYLKDGRKAWENWKQDEWLQNFPEKEDLSYLDFSGVDRKNSFLAYSMGGMQKGTDKKASISFLFQWGNVGSERNDDALQSDAVSYEPEQIYTIELRHVTDPWRAAMDYMKYVYLTGFILVFICLSIVLYVVKKTVKKQETLERTRRDFTNAAAHELKTPLGIIRGFAENAKENTVEEKRDYYLEQIISQTEVMDDLVKEMIGISKMDTDDWVLGKEKVSVGEIIREQMDKLQSMLHEKHIQTDMEIQNDFFIDGDKAQLSKALGNLILNAVEHNLVGGKIKITVDTDLCVIENTGNKISEEDMPYLCDMFFSGDKSRHGSHKGLGLYLAKQIFEMHKLGLLIENVGERVRVTVERLK